MCTTPTRARTSFWRICLLLSIVAVLAPNDARADGLIVPHVGINFGGDSGSELSNAFDAKRLNWGVSFLWMGGGVVGVEGDFGYSPDFFGKTDIGGSSVLSAMGNLVVGVPFGGQKGFGVRPYGLVGLGVIRANGDAFDNPLSFNENKIAWDFGGGVLVFFASHVGIRGDLRYIRTVEAADFLSIGASAEAGHLDFTRGSLGFVFRF